MRFKEVTEAEFKRFLADYPRPLVRNVTTFCEPADVNYNDFQRAPYWPDSVVAGHAMDGGYGAPDRASGWRVLEDVDSPVPDDGKRDTDEPLLDSDGNQLHEGDEVEVSWGRSSETGANMRREKILIRDRGTKYEHWSFESCHNIVRGFDMRRVTPALEASQNSAEPT